MFGQLNGRGNVAHDLLFFDAPFRIIHLDVGAAGVGPA